MAKPIEGLYVDLSGQGGTVNGDNADKYITHNPRPDYLMGFSARFKLQKLWLLSQYTRQHRKLCFNQVAAGASYDQMYQMDTGRISRLSLSETNFVKRQFTTDYYLENASFFKLDNISAGYKFDNIIINWAHVLALRYECADSYKIHRTWPGNQRRNW